MCREEEFVIYSNDERICKRYWTCFDGLDGRFGCSFAVCVLICLLMYIKQNAEKNLQV